MNSPVAPAMIKGATLAAAPSNKRQVQFKTLAEFCGEYEPLAYIVEGVLRSGSLYTLTAKTGTGKTALNVVVALAVATGEGQRLIGCDVAQGRVAYVALENPDDVRMRFLAAAHRYNINIDELGDGLVILDRRKRTEEIWAELESLSLSISAEI